MKKTEYILLVDDDASQRNLLYNFLTKQGYHCQQAEDAKMAIQSLKNNILMIIMDVRMPGMSGLEALKYIRNDFPELPVLIITAYADVRDAVSAIKDGAVDYLAKPIDFHELLSCVKESTSIENVENTYFPKLPDHMILKSKSLLSIVSEISVIAPSQASVLITGESGTGKEVIADLIHMWSERKEQKCIKVNCAAIPDNLMESELFGHEKGAFTGAVSKRKGCFEEANNGTLFLDEIADMSLGLQAKLLRVVQEGTFQKLGSNNIVKVNIRIIAATNHDIEKAVQDGLFREDLFYRLNVIQIHIPPLRDRREDILPLARYFAKVFSGSNVRFSSAAESILEIYDWPGNIRQLRNVVERACLLSRGEIILPEQFPAKIYKKEEISFEKKGTLMEDMERNTILRALAKVNGNRTQASKDLGISRRSLIYKLQKYKEEGYTF